MKLEDFSKEQLADMVRHFRKLYNLQMSITAAAYDAIDEMPIDADEFLGDEVNALWAKIKKLKKNPPWKKK